MINVTTPLKGRLGNHLFQIGAIQSFAHEKGYKPIFSWSWPNNEAKQKSLLLSNVEFCDKSIFDTYRKVEHNFFDFQQLPSLNCSSIIHGNFCFFQDYKYLNKDLILDLFINKDLKCSVLRKYNDIEERTSIHIRRADYIRREKIGSNQFVIPGPRYYESAIALSEGCKFIIFSDDIEWCQKKFKLTDVIYSNDEEDFSIMAMSMCKSNIISASTFGWWGAYLNQNKDAKVIAPKQWFRPECAEVKEGFTTVESSIKPKTWISIDSHPKKSLRIGIRLKKFRRGVVKKIKQVCQQA